MSEPVKTFFAGIIAIGLVAAIGLHGAGLATAINAAGTQAGGLLNTAEQGQATTARSN